jgi:hypothetical protein
MRQGIFLEPLLEAISSFLDRHHEMMEQVRRDLERGLKKASQGPPRLLQRAERSRARLPQDPIL